MTSEPQRRLSAILVADVVEYSRLVRLDEPGTISALRGVLDNIVRPTLTRRNGRLVKLLGDGALAEFASVVDAVRCAVDIQTAMTEWVSDLPEASQIRFRIGINLGDIIIDGDDVLGDGVNLAARLEGLAEPGGICVSRTVVTHVGNKADVTFRPMGPQKVKNFADPVEAFSVAVGVAPVVPAPGKRRRLVPAAIAVAVLLGAGGWWLTRPDFTPADQAKMTMPLPASPSIAVLPFDYLGQDKEENDYIADGLSENIISTLARIPDLLVIARNSTFTYKGKPVDVREVAENFGVRHVLEGSVQVSGDTMRVTAQLVDGVDGRHLWTQVYDRPVADIFAVQDEITLSVAQAIYGKTIAGNDLMATGGTSSLEAWAEWVAGSGHLIKALPEDILRSEPYFHRAIALDPDFAFPYASLAHVEFFKARYALSDDPAKSLDAAVELANNALALDPNNSLAYSALGMALLIQRRADAAANAVIEGARVAPGSAFSHASAAWVLTYVGRAEEAQPFFERAKRMYVYPPWWMFGTQSQGLADLGEHAAANEVLRVAEGLSPPGLGLFWHAGYAQNLLALGQEENARREIAKAFELDSNLSIQALRVWDFPYSDPTIPERRYQRLRTLGVPDVPPVAN